MDGCCDRKSEPSCVLDFYIQIVKSFFFPSSEFSFLFLSAAQVPHPESKHLDPLLDSGGGMYKLGLNRGPYINNEPQPLE